MSQLQLEQGGGWRRSTSVLQQMLVRALGLHLKSIGFAAPCSWQLCWKTVERCTCVAIASTTVHAHLATGMLCKKAIERPVEGSHSWDLQCVCTDESHLPHGQSMVGMAESKHVFPAGITHVCSPRYLSDARKCEVYNQGLGLFVGNTYIKCLSLAWLIEWILVDGLRPEPLSDFAYR